MMFRSIIVAGILLLCACASPPVSPVVEWVSFAAEIDRLAPPGLAIRHKSLQDIHSAQPDDDNRMRLAYVLSRPNAATQDLTKSSALLADIDAGSAYAPLRDMLKREIALTTELRLVRRKLDELKSQLEMLKTIDGDLTESRKAVDEVAQ